MSENIESFLEFKAMSSNYIFLLSLKTHGDGNDNDSHTFGKAGTSKYLAFFT